MERFFHWQNRLNLGRKSTYLDYPETDFHTVSFAAGCVHFVLLP